MGELCHPLDHFCGSPPGVLQKVHISLEDIILFCTFVSKLAEEHRCTSPGKSWSKLEKSFFLKICRPGTTTETEISSSLMSWRQPFVWAHLEGDSYLRGAANDPYLSVQECLHMTFIELTGNAT